MPWEVLFQPAIRSTSMARGVSPSNSMPEMLSVSISSNTIEELYHGRVCCQARSKAVPDSPRRIAARGRDPRNRQDPERDRRAAWYLPPASLQIGRAHV